MTVKNILKTLGMPLLCAAFLGACASAEPRPVESDGVQDITPGEKSLIQPPSQSSSTGQPGIQEKNI